MAEELKNPLQDALLVLDWIDGSRLGELAAQKGVLPSPTRRERSREKKRGVGIQGVGPIAPKAEMAGSTGEVDVYETAENPALLIAGVVGSLIRDKQIELGIADVPSVSVDAPLDEVEIEYLLIKELEERTGPDDVSALAKEVAKILGQGLPPERLAGAKKEELETLKQGMFALIESEWDVESTNSLLMLSLGSLHAPGEVELSTANRVDVPEAIRVRVTLQTEELTPRAQSRFDGSVQAGIFGEVLKSNSGVLEIWPIAVFSRIPSV